MKIQKRLGIFIAFVLIMSSVAASAVTMGVVRTPTNDGSAWLRAGGGTSYRALGYTNHGDLLVIQQVGRSWNKVTMRSGRMTGATGWIYKKYVTTLKNPEDITGWGALAHIKTKYADSTVHLRKGPGTKYAIKDYLSRNDLMIILNKYNSKWYEVQVVNTLRTGYVYKDYIANGAIGHATANVNLRKSASTTARILTTIPNGSEILVLNIGKNWSKVTYCGKTGYIYNAYMKLG